MCKENAFVRKKLQKIIFSILAQNNTSIKALARTTAVYKLPMRNFEQSVYLRSVWMPDIFKSRYGKGKEKNSFLIYLKIKTRV